MAARVFSKLLTFFIKILYYFRYYFWKGILYLRGGSLGENVTIHSQVKLVSNKDRPIHIGDNVTIMHGVVISTSEKGHVCIGNGAYICEYSIITSNKKIIIEDNVMIAPHSDIVDFDHKIDDLGTITHQIGIAKTITIKSNAWIASNCCILKGVTIGQNVVIGAGSVVTKDIPANSVAIGSPARVVKTLK